MALQNTALQTTKQSPSLSALLQQPAYSDRFKEVLGLRAPQFVSSLIQVGRELDDCEPQSIIAAGMTAATLDLPINKSLGFAWIVPYKTKINGQEVKLAQFQIGAKGYTQLALRTGQYKHLNHCEVYDGELVELDKLTGTIKLDPSKRKPKSEVVGYAAYMRLITGFEHAEYWTFEEVQDHADAYSQAYRAAKKYDKKDAPWIADFDAMAKKTVLSMLIRKWGPMSVQLQVAVTRDQAVQIDVDAEVQYIDNQPTVKTAEAPMIEGGQQAPEPTKRDNPNAALEAQMKLDKVSGEQVLTALKQTGFADQSITEVFQLSDEKINQLLDAWPNLLNQFKAVKVK